MYELGSEVVQDVVKLEIEKQGFIKHLSWMKKLIYERRGIRE